MSAEREAYRAALNNVFHGQKGHTCRNPTRAQLDSITPHLHPRLLTNLLKMQKVMCVALPPLEIAGAYLCASFEPLGDGEVSITITGAFKVRSNKPDNSTFVLFKQEAETYANERWETFLTVDTSLDYMFTHVLDPSKRYPTTYPVVNLRGAPRHVYTFHCLLSRRFNEILASRTITPSSLWDNSLIVFTTDTLAGTEYAIARQRLPYYNCAYCGFGLLKDHCPNCRHQFREDKVESHLGWNTPLPHKIVEYLKTQKHVFGQNPDIGYVLERSLMREVKPS